MGASVLASLLGAAPARAAPLTLCADYICIGVNDWGTLGQGHGTPPGIQYDSSGTGNFPQPDYLTPGIPYDGFSIVFDGGSPVRNNNNFGNGRQITGVLTDESGNGFDNRAVWTGTFSDGGGAAFTVTRDFGFNDRDRVITVTTTIKAERDLTGVLFSHQNDPDANGESSTLNGVGTGDLAGKIVFAQAPISQFVIGFFSDDPVAHNTGITSPWSDNPQSYIDGVNAGNGDNAIGIGFELGDMLAGEEITFVYLMLFGNDLDDFLSQSGGGGSTPTIAERGQTPQQTQIGGALDSLGAGNPLHDAVSQLPDEELPGALNQLNGELHASGQTVVLDSSRYVRSITVDRTRVSFGDQAGGATQALSYAPGQQVIESKRYGISFWGQGYGSWGHTGGGIGKLDHSVGGFMLGLDGALTDYWRLGVSGGYSFTSLDQSGLNSSADVATYQVTAYTGLQFDALGLRAGATHSWHNLDTKRSIAFVGFNDSLYADYDARSWQVFGEVGYTLAYKRFAFEPFAGLSHVRLDIDGFTERGGIASLTTASSHQNTTYTTLGLRAAVALPLSETTPVSLRTSLAWQRSYGARRPGLIFAFDGSTPFTTTAQPAARNTLVTETGFDIDITPDTTLGLSYTGQYGSRVRDHGVKGNFTIRF